jgi:hypothetical protein
LLLLLFFSFSFLSADHELVHGRSQELLDRMSRIDSWHRQISTSRHFQNGHHNVAQIQHEQCWICAVLWWPFWKWRPVEIFWCQESIRDIIIYPHMKCRWNRTMLNLCYIVLSVAGLGNSIIYYNHILLLLLFFSFSFLSADHELVHGRSQELLDRMSRIDSWHRQISTSLH